MGMKVLIIGNGFDLAHGLPTSYADFLEFAERFQKIYIRDESTTTEEFKNDYIAGWEENEYIKNNLLDLFSKRVPLSPEEKVDSTDYWFRLNDERINGMSSNLRDNIWFKYFCELHQENKIRGKNWIDFESEISRVIQWIDRKFPSLEGFSGQISAHASIPIEGDEKMRWIWRICEDFGIDSELPLNELVNRLYLDLERITEALETYLAVFVEKIPAEKIEVIAQIKPDYVISFNYTHTYQEVYNKEAHICYIHGECRKDLEEPCNMVIGIEQYLDETERDRMTNMAIFKKFIQRIRKKNDRVYRDVHNELKENYEFWHARFPSMKDGEGNLNENAIIYVYGHSLDVTDSDVLSEILGAECASLVVFAKGKQKEGELISNLIKLIGEENLISKAYEKPTMLEFRIV